MTIEKQEKKSKWPKALLALIVGAGLVATQLDDGPSDTPPDVGETQSNTQTTEVETVAGVTTPNDPTEASLYIGDRLVDSAKAFICKINPDNLGNEVSKGLFGTNLEWFNDANGIADDKGNIDPEWIQLAIEQGIDNVRFPGGTLSDFYNWKDGIGPVSSRPIIEHPTDIGRSPNPLGTTEFIRFCQSINARPLITVNGGTGSAQEAAEWVAYCNQQNNALRTADGFPEPFGVELWEIGNELYLPGNPSDDEIISKTPEEYADLFLEYAKAMRAVDPDIKLMAIGTANASTFKLPHPDWTETVMAKAASEMDYYAVHNSYFPMLFGSKKDFTIKQVYQSLWSTPEAVDRSLDALDAIISKNENSRHVQIAITEWGALFSFDKEWIDHVKTQGSAVYLARLMQVYILQPRVTFTNYFKFTDHSFMGWVGYDKKPKVPYFVIQLFAKHFGDRLVEASIESPTYSVSPLAVMDGEKDVPELTVVASLSQNREKLFVNIVSRSWSAPRSVQFDTGSFNANTTATAWIISAKGVTDNNGRDLPPWIPASSFEEPPESRSPKSFIGIEEQSIDISTPVTIPPHSIVTIEFDITS